MPDDPAFAEPEGFSHVPRGHSKLLSLLAVVVAIGVVIGIANFLLVAQPVQQQLQADPRNHGVSLTARYASYVDPRTLVLDLRAVRDAAPADLFRTVLQSAHAFHQRDQRFERVVLARSGKPVFVMEGRVFATLGAEFGADDNPLSLVRTLPSHLLRPSGVAAFGTWEGGLLGVSIKQLEDASEAARQWAGSVELRRDWSGGP